MIDLRCGNCLAEMKNMSDNSIDLVVTDPPYKVTSRGGYTSAGGILITKKMREGKVFEENDVNLGAWLCQ